MPFEVVLDTILARVTLASGEGALSTWRSYYGQRRKPEEPCLSGTSREVNRTGRGECERALKLRLLRKGLSGKAKAKTGIEKFDLPGL